MAIASVMLPLGTPAPPFALCDVVSGQIYSLDSFTVKTALLVMFICRHCPYVVHVEQGIAKIGRDYIDTGLGIIGISSNDPAQYPDDAPPRLKEMVERLGFTFPFCFDENQDVAKAYQATCTPDFYLFNRERQLVYRGQLDDSRPGSNKPVTGRDLRTATTQCLPGSPSTVTRRPVSAAASSGSNERNGGLLISCARATRGLRRPSLNARSGRSSSPPFPRRETSELGGSVLSGAPGTRALRRASFDVRSGGSVDTGFRSDRYQPWSSCFIRVSSWSNRSW